MAENMHDPCCSSHGKTLTCPEYRRTHFVEVRPCCAADRVLLDAERALRPDLPAWCYTGARVATMTNDARPSVRNLAFTTVERVTKRDVVLADGQRYSNGLRRRQGGTWGSTYAVYAASDPFVKKVRDEVNAYRRDVHARSTVEKWLYRREGVTAADAIRALAPLTDVGDRIIALLPPEEASP